MKILFCGYREWALKIYTSLDLPCALVSTPEKLKEETKVNTYDIIFFVGWSWFIEDDIINSSKCICLHPSPLPKYRGGSPIQHQIINGEAASAVTFFLMDDELDHGPILWRREFSLSGNLEDILLRISALGSHGVTSIIQGLDMEGVEQNHSEATTYKRRSPSDSEIKAEDFSAFTGKELYNKIRCLQDPYPNAFVKCKDGTLLYLTGARHEEDDSLPACGR